MYTSTAGATAATTTDIARPLKTAASRGARATVGVARDAPRRLDGIQEVRRRAVGQAVVVLVVLDVARARAAGAAGADRATEALGDDALDRERPDRVSAVVVVDGERVLEREDRGLDRAIGRRGDVVAPGRGVRARRRVVVGGRGRVGHAHELVGDEPEERIA